MTKHVPMALPWSWHKTPGWRGQYDRLLRWHSRLSATKEPDEVEDFLFAFFQTAAHLSDWLLNDHALEEAEVQGLLASYEELRLCRDISNATKHFSLDRTPFQEEFSLARVFVGKGLGRFGEDASLWVLVGGKTYDAFDLAAKCLSIWREFLVERGLLG